MLNKSPKIKPRAYEMCVCVIVKIIRISLLSVWPGLSSIWELDEKACLCLAQVIHSKTKQNGPLKCPYSLIN